MKHLYKANEGGVFEVVAADSKFEAFLFLTGFWGHTTMLDEILFFKEYNPLSTLDEFVDDFFRELPDDEELTITDEKNVITLTAKEWAKGYTKASWVCGEAT